MAAKAAAVVARGPVAIELDAAQYWILSSSPMQGDFCFLDHPIAYRTPVYPWFLSCVRAIFGINALAAIAVIQSSMSLASTWMAARLAARITGLPRALPIALIVSLPAISALTFNAAVLSESLFVFLLMLNVSAVEAYVNRPTSLNALWVGVSFAATLLTRPIVLLLWIPHLAFIVVARIRKHSWPNAPMRPRFPSKTLLIHAAIAGLACLAMVGPWLVRNQILFDKPFLTEFVGRNLWVVTFQNDSGAGFELPETDSGRKLKQRLDRVDLDANRDATWAVSGALTASGLNDAQTDQLMKRVAIDAIRRDPSRFGMKAMIRIVNFWRTRATELPLPSEQGDFMGQAVWRLDVPVVQWLIEHRAGNVLWLNNMILIAVTAASALLIAHGSSRTSGLWMAMMLMYFAIITGIFEIPAYRYRMVIEPLATCVIGAALAVLLSKRTKQTLIVGEGN